jgi:hypothetical protein
MGRIFSAEHHRALGIHWGVLWQNTISKAKDPWINSFTLARLLRDPKTKEAALTNAMSRFANNMVLCRALLTGDFPDPLLKEKLVEHIAKNIADLDTLQSNDKVRMLASLPPADVSTVHQLWLKFKPAGLSGPKTDESTDTDSFNNEQNVSVRLTLIYDTGWRFASGWDMQPYTYYKAFMIDGKIFVI